MLGTGETPSDPRNCGQVVPEIGITATPVVDRSKDLLYVAAMSKDAGGHYYQRVHALSLASGKDLYSGVVQASTPGIGDGSSNGAVNFDPGQYKERPGLLLVGTTLYTSWGSHCDNKPYSGWVLSYSTDTGKQTGVFNFAPNGGEAAPWNAGAGPAADAAGNVFISLGNGTFDTGLTPRGFPRLGAYGNAVVKLSSTNGALEATDYWTMDNSNLESGGDTDLGSGGLMLLPSQVDSGGITRKLAVAAGKDSNLYVLNQESLGRYDASANATVYQVLPGALSNGMWSSPAYFNGHIFYGSVNSVLRSFDLRNARLSSSPSSSTTVAFAYPGTTPSVSAYGTQNGIVWAVENTSPAVLHAFDAGNLATEFYNSNQVAGGRDQFGSGNKFMTPMIANGKVYVGTPNSVAVFGILPKSKAPVPDGDYSITNNGSGLLVTDYATSPSPSTEIIQYPTYPGLYQTWFFSWQGSGYYLLQNAASGWFLSAPEGAQGSAPALHASPTFDDSQLWELRTSGSEYVIRNKGTGLVLGSPASDPNPAGIQVQTENGGTNQEWTVRAAK